MSDATQGKGSPTRGLWRRFLLLVPLALVLVLASRAYIRGRGGVYEASGLLPHEGREYTLDDAHVEVPGVVEVVAVGTTDDGHTQVTFGALAEGETGVTVGDGLNDDYWLLRVEDGTIIEGGVNFSGWESVEVCLCVFLVAAIVLFGSALARLARRSWYGYTMVACGGGLLFCLFQLVLLLATMVRGDLRDFADLAYHITYMADYFVSLSLVPFGVLALLVSLSNVSLIRHEGMRPVNLLGIAASLLWAGANFFWWRAGMVAYDMFGSFAVAEILDTLVASAVSFGECLLLSTVLCAVMASRHMPRHGADYLIVLGCGIRPDGTPCPLLAGRVDKALAFDAQRVEEGDVPATFVPSGGRGSDEPVSEAQSMASYLEARGVPAGRIVLEDRSTTTRENMAFSREAIERHAGGDVGEVLVVFSTTNYHVFRGYVCAHQAGMDVEGLGARTRAYFWPNAFLREFAGLLVAQWRSILRAYLVIAFVYGIAAYALTLT